MLSREVNVVCFTHTKEAETRCEQFRFLDSLYVFDATFQYTRQTIYHHTRQAIRTICHSFYTAPCLATRFVNLYLRKQ